MLIYIHTTIRTLYVCHERNSQIIGKIIYRYPWLVIAIVRLVMWIALGLGGEITIAYGVRQ